jgi:hypothetical protein
LNKISRDHYKEWNWKVANNIYPLIVAMDMEEGAEGIGSSFYLYLRDGTVKRARPTDQMYEIHKSLSHLALGVACILSPYLLHPKTTFSKAPLMQMQNQIHLTLTSLKDVELDDSNRDHYTLAKSILELHAKHITNWIHSGEASLSSLKEFGKAVTPLLKESGKFAAHIQMKAMINVLQKWKLELGPEEWTKLHAVIPTVWPVSSDSPREVALRHVMDPATVGTNLVIAEGAKSEADARVTLGRTKDKSIAHLIFGTDDIESRSMVCAYSSPRDLLADAVDEAVDHLVKKKEIPTWSGSPKNYSDPNQKLGSRPQLCTHFDTSSFNKKHYSTSSFRPMSTTMKNVKFAMKFFK